MPRKQRRRDRLQRHPGQQEQDHESAQRGHASVRAAALRHMRLQDYHAQTTDAVPRLPRRSRRPVSRVADGARGLRRALPTKARNCTREDDEPWRIAKSTPFVPC
jgi:hypothetical protein